MLELLKLNNARSLREERTGPAIWSSELSQNDNGECFVQKLWRTARWQQQSIQPTELSPPSTGPVSCSSCMPKKLALGKNRRPPDRTAGGLVRFGDLEGGWYFSRVWRMDGSSQVRVEACSFPAEEQHSPFSSMLQAGFKRLGVACHQLRDETER